MFGIIAALMIIVPFVELIVIIKVADGIGLLPTLLLLVLISIAGAWLLAQQGAATWRRLRATLKRGDMPTEEATDGALIVVGGSLLLTPGFVTDAIGLWLLMPVTRRLVKSSFKKLLAVVAARRFGRARTAAAGRAAHEVRATRIRREPTAPDEGVARPGSDLPVLPQQSPSPEHPHAGDGSPDRA